MPNFIHLHNHSHIGSVFDSVSSPYDIIRDKVIIRKGMMTRCKEIGMDALAITDHGSMAAVIPFYKAAVANKIKPILGVEAYYTDDYKDDGYCHLLILAKNINGFRSLMKATSKAYTDGYYKKTQRKTIIGRMDWETVNQLEDVVITTACIGGLVNGPFLKSKFNDETTGLNRAERFFKRFGNDFYIELGWHSRNAFDFVTTNEYSMEVANKLGIATVITNDCHYTYKEDAELHRFWLAAGVNQHVDRHNYIYDDTYYIKTAEEMTEIAPDDQCIKSTVEINNKIDFVDLNLNIAQMPRYEGLSDEEAGEKLVDLVISGLEKNGWAENETYLVRAEKELDFLLSNNLSSYFLPIWDALEKGREMGVGIGPARGSSAGSLVIKAIDVVEIDPLEYGLQFERFLNEGRCGLKRGWKVEDEDGHIYEVFEGYKYHIQQPDGSFLEILGEKIVEGV